MCICEKRSSPVVVWGAGCNHLCVCLCDIFLHIYKCVLSCGGGGLVAKSCPILATPWTVARQPPPSMGFSRQEYWSGLPFPSPGDLPNPGIKSRSPALQTDSLLTELSENKSRSAPTPSFFYPKGILHGYPKVLKGES